MASVVIEQLTKSFSGPGGEIRAVREVNLAVSNRELLVLVGPSGSGKTTLLRLIAGLEQPTSGTICIDGVEVTRAPPQDRGVAMVFQEHALYPHMTVRENLALGLKLRKASKSDIEQRVREAAELLGLAPLLGRKPAALSGGERQRAALGRSLVLRPRVFILDEPLSNLDAPLRALMRREIVRLHQRLKTTMIYVTHDQAEAMTLGDRIAVIKDGEIQQAGQPLDLYHRPENLFVASFIGTPPMNLFAGTVVRKGEALWFRADPERGADGREAFELAFKLPEVDPGGSPLSAKLSCGRIVVGLRPEHIREITAASRAEDEATVEAAVEGAEPMGWETHLWLRKGEFRFVARVLGDAPPRVGETLRLAFDISRAHFFGGADGKRIG